MNKFNAFEAINGTSAMKLEGEVYDRPARSRLKPSRNAHQFMAQSTVVEEIGFGRYLHDRVAEVSCILSTKTTALQPEDDMPFTKKVLILVSLALGTMIFLAI